MQSEEENVIIEFKVNTLTYERGNEYKEEMPKRRRGNRRSDIENDPLCFNGSKVSIFLKKYEAVCDQKGLDAVTKATDLPLYVHNRYFETVRQLPGFRNKNWVQLKRSMKENFLDIDFEEIGQRRKAGRPGVPGQPLTGLQERTWSKRQVSIFFEKLVEKAESEKFTVTWAPQEDQGMYFDLQPLDGQDTWMGIERVTQIANELMGENLTDLEINADDEDAVTLWWKQNFGNDSRGEGHALTNPWYSWKLWGRKRKCDDRQEENATAEARAAEAEENTYQNSRFQTEREAARASRRREPSRPQSSREPSGSSSSREPSRFKTSREPSGIRASHEPSVESDWGQSESDQDEPLLTKEEYKEYHKRLNYQDFDEETAWGSKIREPFGIKDVVVPRGTCTPGQIPKLAKTGVRILTEKDFKGLKGEEPLGQKIRTWRKGVHEADRGNKENTRTTDSDSEGSSDEQEPLSSDSEGEDEVEITHKKTYEFAASAAELLEEGLSPATQARLAATVCAGDREKYEGIIYEVNTKYKPVGKKINPIPIALPDALNPPLRRPPLSRDPYVTPLTHEQPKFVPGGKLTEERIALMDFGPEGWLSEDERNLMLHVLRLREKALAFDGNERGELKSTYADPYKIPVVPHTPWRQSALPIPLAAREKILELFKARMEEGLYERSSSAYSGRWFVVAKKDGKFRIVHDLQPLNAVTIRDAGLPPVIEDFIEDFTGRACLGLMDVFGGFDQRDLAEASRDLTTFNTPWGAVRLTKLPTGATTSVAEFQGAMVHILAEEIPEYAGVFVDDVGIKGPKSTYNDEKVPWNPNIRRFIWEYAVTLERILFRFEKQE
ncbi:hypothetical protein P7C70_g4857, partial [Phenoliferia sp. Uapishka_3]